MNEYFEIKDENEKVCAKIKITEQMKNDLQNQKDTFKGTISTVHMIECPNGFVGVGILKKPQDHIVKNINKIYLCLTGFNKDGTRIVPINEIIMKTNELKILSECINEFIKKMKR